MENWTPSNELPKTEEEIKAEKKRQAIEKAKQTRARNKALKEKALEEAKKDLKKEQQFLELQAENNPPLSDEKKNENRELLQHLQWGITLSKIDMNDKGQVANRIGEYFNHCMNDGYKPTISGLSNSLGITRETLTKYRYGNVGDKEIKDIIVKAYTMLEELWELSLNQGKINPVSGIFFGKNLYNYSDKQEINITAQNSYEKLMMNLHKNIKIKLKY